ncbi:FMN-dependent dehydrogenase [Rhodofomes roseus]|uniref:FMN-dependent dehydrogenase n=1 Tax=Rhodofomes roseus TaxID=34475 RepID=A0ABQ8K4B2_9APHY|nr:FMN-dependent dehydrogenase [Rhodofomes roseus]KAH9831329.1 FMN-dependent dehydrogenase [Rhodofomes roseus]
MRDTLTDDLLPIATSSSTDAYLYVYGSAGTCSTHEDNIKEFGKWKIVPRVMTDASNRNLETTLFGVKYPSPVLLAPIGVQGIVHPDGEVASSGAAGKLGVPYIMSTASTRSIEAVAKANGPNGHRWYQLYWPRHDDVTISLLNRIKASGFSTLVITLDTMLLGWRPHDIQTSYLPFLQGVGCHIGFTDPAFMARHGEEPLPLDSHPEFPYDPDKVDERILSGDAKAQRTAELGQAWITEVTSGWFRTWQHLPFIRQHWDGPVVLKGVLCAEDAELAIDHGVDGIVVSNHGGRQVDGSVSTLYALHAIMQSQKVRDAQAAGKFTVLMDSGIRTGSDVIKAIALGADAVLYGRPYMYALTLAGEEGVEHQIKSLLADTETSLGLSGFSNLEEIRGKWEKVLVKD